MTKLGDLLGAYQTNLPITPRHEEWLRENQNASYTELAREFLGIEVGKPQRDRRNTFSASGQSVCPRRRQFSFMGMPERAAYSTHTISIFHNGTWTHLRWQLAGLSAGWLAMAEVPTTDVDLMLSGTMDGILDDYTTGLEIKSINSNGFNRVMTYGILEAHKNQANAYFLMTDLDRFSFIYENKDTQDYREIVYPRDEKQLGIEREYQEQLVEMTVDRHLWSIKPGCAEKVGTEYLQCPFREVCLQIRSWQQAEEVACGSSERKLTLRRTSSSPSD